MGRQHQGMDRPGVRLVPEGSGEQGKIDETGSKIICGAPATLAVKELMMMMTVLFLWCGQRASFVVYLRRRDGPGSYINWCLTLHSIKSFAAQAD